MIKPHLTIICPVFNEEKTVPLFYERIVQLFAKLAPQFETSLLFFDNCSSDRTLDIIRGLALKDSRVYHLGLSINVGYQKSVECGLRNAVGDFFAIVDVDCEDPPEMVADFLEIQKQGFDIVYGERVDREEGAIMKGIRKLFYRFTRFVSDEHFFVDMAEFCLLTSEVRDAIIQDENSFPFIRSSIGRVGFTHKGVPYKRHNRIAGETHYNFYRMSTFAIAGILSSSTLPLRFMIYSFPFLTLLFLVGWGFVFRSLESFIFSVALFYISFGLAFNSVYLARVYKNGLGRPNAIVVKRKTKRQPSADSSV